MEPTTSAAFEPPPIWGTLAAGEFGVGYATGWGSDAARPLPDGRPRPLQVSVWYPAASDPRATNLHYRDYVGLMASELLTGPATAEQRARTVADYRDLLVGQAGLSQAAADAMLAAPMAAQRGLTPAAGSFPPVLLAQGHGGSPHRESVLCEVLASHGFVVLTVPSQARISGFPKSPAELPAKVADQAADLAWLADHAAGLSPARLTAAMGVIGYSFGARSALEFDLERHRAAAMVSLDGGIGNHEGRELLVAAPWFRPEEFTTPLLHVFQPGDEAVTPDFELIERLARAPRVLVEVRGLGHGHFSNSAMLRTLGPGFDALVPPELDPQPAFEQTLLWMEAFLEAHLDGRPGALVHLLAAGAQGPVLAIKVLPGTD